MHNDNWIKNLQNITTSAELEEFIMLFMALLSIFLSDQKDEIQWRWTGDGCYTVASAYDCQFFGNFSCFLARQIWKAQTEPKCRFFEWLVMHDRILTAHNMIKRNWPCDHNCSLCLCMHETTEHLLIKCNYIEAVWNLIAPTLHLKDYSLMIQSGGPKNWVNELLHSGSSKTKKINLGALFSFWWMIWREQNRRIFQHKELSPLQLSTHILDEIKLISVEAGSDSSS
jgi:hypothetical protein